MTQAKHPGPGQSTPGCDGVAFGLLARRLSDELAALSWIAEDLQTSTAHLDARTTLTASESQSLQALDRLTQTLHDLSRALRHISTEAPDGRIDGDALAKTLTLGDLRMRLLTGHGRENTGQGTGVVSLF